LGWEKAKEGKQAINAPDWIKFLLDLKCIKNSDLNFVKWVCTS